MKDPIKITDRIKTFNDAKKASGISDKITLMILTLLALFSKKAKASLALLKLTIIISALNEGWEPDWRNPNERKYYPWFDMSAGVGLSYHVYDYTSSRTLVGSRLVLKSSELAEYAGKQFQHIYKKAFCL